VGSRGHSRSKGPRAHVGILESQVVRSGARPRARGAARHDRGQAGGGATIAEFTGRRAPSVASLRSIWKRWRCRRLPGGRRRTELAQPTKIPGAPERAKPMATEATTKLRIRVNARLPRSSHGARQILSDKLGCYFFLACQVFRRHFCAKSPLSAGSPQTRIVASLLRRSAM